MKPLSELLKYFLVAFATISIIAACAIVSQKKNNVEFGQYYAAILPEAKVSESDCDALNRILKKYDKRIYRIQTFKNGRVIKTQGKLAEEYIRAGLVSEVAKKALATGFTGCALQAGLNSSTHPTPGPDEGGTSSTHPTPSPPEGEGGTSSTHPTPSVTPVGGSTTARPRPNVGSSTKKLLEESKEMMEQVQPILEKYNKK